MYFHQSHQRDLEVDSALFSSNFQSKEISQVYHKINSSTLNLVRRFLGEFALILQHFTVNQCVSHSRQAIAVCVGTKRTRERHTL